MNKMTNLGGALIADAVTGRAGGSFPHATYLMFLTGFPTNPDSNTTGADWLALETTFGGYARPRLDTNCSAPEVYGSVTRVRFPATFIGILALSPTTAPITSYAIVDNSSGAPTAVWAYGLLDKSVSLASNEIFYIAANGLTYMVG